MAVGSITMNWNSMPKPAELAESRLIAAILEGHFAIGDNLPNERDLSTQLGVTRPTLREVLQRLARDGWLEINHGRPTRVRDYWQEGNLGVLGALARTPEHAPANFVPDLLRVRQLLAPAYTRLAVEREAAALADFLQPYLLLPDTAVALSQADWHLHHRLTVASGNPIFTLILNGFEGLYQVMGPLFFARPEARARSHFFYRQLLAATQTADADAAEQLAGQIMAESLAFWQAAVAQQG
jgi:GntR family transcriptional regulator, negative regulator for fad regulon and positive regulator of fabA